jgi:hypothetical protein
MRALPSLSTAGGFDPRTPSPQGSPMNRGRTIGGLMIDWACLPYLDIGSY